MVREIRWRESLTTENEASEVLAEIAGSVKSFLQEGNNKEGINTEVEERSCGQSADDLHIYIIPC